MYHILHVFWASSPHRVTNFQAFCSSSFHVQGHTRIGGVAKGGGFPTRSSVSNTAPTLGVGMKFNLGARESHVKNQLQPEDGENP